MCSSFPAYNTTCVLNTETCFVVGVDQKSFRKCNLTKALLQENKICYYNHKTAFL